MRTSTVATAALLLLTAAAALLTLRNFQRAELAAADAAQTPPRYTLTQVQWTRLNESGEPEYIANARSIDYYDDHSAHLDQPDIVAFGGKGSPWRLTAPEGRTPANSRDLLLQGNVLIQGRWSNGRELTLTTPYLWVESQQKRLRTDAEVVMQGAGRKLSATGLIADSMGERVQLLGKVRGEYAPRS